MKLQIIFLIIVLVVAPFTWWIPRQFAARLMMAATIVTLGYFAPLSLIILIASSVLQWLTWQPYLKMPQKARNWISVIIPLLPLLICKIEFTYAHWLIPLGLSYYSFRQIHVAFEVYKKTMRPPSLIEYFEYLLFLPVILIGPIHRMPEFQRSLRRRKWNFVQISQGLERILYGFVKISFFGNFLFSIGLKNLALGTSNQLLRFYLEVVSFTGNAYVQFAGYSDLAIGAGLLWGVKVMENFNAPFMATNMQVFWQRWHISLSSWCREYIFQPIAGFTRNRWLGLIASMLALALWHEISLRYIVWGALQATLILLTVSSRKLMPSVSYFINENKVGKWIGRIWVFHLFAFSCIFIASESIESLGPIFKKLF